MTRMIKKISVLPMIFAIIITLPLTYSSSISISDDLKDKFKNTVVLFLNSPYAYYKDSVLKIDNNNSVKPIIKNNRTLVPIRFISEAFGAQVDWNQASKTAYITLAGERIALTLGISFMTVSREIVPMEISPASIGGRTFVPLRDLATALGKKVFWDEKGLIVISDRDDILDSRKDSGMINEVISLIDVPIEYLERNMHISTGNKKARIIRINPKSPNISFEVNIPNTKLNVTENFDILVRNKKAFAAVNANFFESYAKIKDPIGNVMVNGKLILGQSGITTVGITRNKEFIFSKPGTFVKGWCDGKEQNVSKGNGDFEYNTWTLYEVNTISQTKEGSILYTPERGSSIDITVDGYVAVVRNSKVANRYFVKAPGSVAIPKDGYVAYFGKKNAENQYSYRALTIGRNVLYKYYLHNNTNPKFKWENIEWALSGGPDLVTDGKASPVSTHQAFKDPKFTTQSYPRTALGITADNKVYLVNVEKATINELKEIMLALKSYDAVNLDGGDSTGMYYNGKLLVKPGRKLVTVLYVYKQ
jgi:exopolysaccharide biosynthesis protein